ncbi:MAG: SET domain-containing protein [Geobacteraceae bacterium]|nr:SET domain-containing protein [Geobacteraceae bacterium]
MKESQIPESGNGLFTAIPIFKDEVISIFKGKILSNMEAEHRTAKGKDSYFINLPDGTIMDSMTVKCFAKYANDAMGFTKTIHKNNSKISLDVNGKVCVVATKKIPVGAEIFCGYGKGYWKNSKLSSLM